MAVSKYAYHPSIQKIKSSGKGFKFKEISPDSVKDKVKGLSTGKSSRGDIPTSILKKCIDITTINLTDCFNASVNDGNFPDEMKLADVTSAFKKRRKN